MEKRVALITGGSRGIGLGIARALASEGIDLAINGQRAAAEVEPVLKELSAAGVGVLYVQGDISKAEDRQRLIENVQQHYGSLTVLVNNAGVAPNVRADILDATEESFDRLVNINLKGPYFLTQAVARWMIDQQSTSVQVSRYIINITSISATAASVKRGDYCITKAGLAMSSKLWAVRLAEHGINVYEVRPGIIETDMTAAVKEKYDNLINAGLVLQNRWGNPADVGKAVASLVRGDLGYSTGQVLMVDGGFDVDRL